MFASLRHASDPGCVGLWHVASPASGGMVVSRCPTLLFLHKQFCHLCPLPLAIMSPSIPCKFCLPCEKELLWAVVEWNLLHPEEQGSEGKDLQTYLSFLKELLHQDAAGHVASMHCLSWKYSCGSSHQNTWAEGCGTWHSVESEPQSSHFFYQVL